MALVEEAGGVFFFSVGTLAVQIAALFLGAGAEGFVGGLEGDAACGIGLCHYIAAAVVGIEGTGSVAEAVKYPADAAAVIAATDEFTPEDGVSLTVSVNRSGGATGEDGGLRPYGVISWGRELFCVGF